MYFILFYEKRTYFDTNIVFVFEFQLSKEENIRQKGNYELFFVPIKYSYIYIFLISALVQAMFFLMSSKEKNRELKLSKKDKELVKSLAGKMLSSTTS